MDEITTSAKPEIITEPKVSLSPHVGICIRAWYELFNVGMVRGDCPFSWDNEALFALVDGKPVGFIVWRLVNWNHQGEIQLGYVDPDYRRQGIYTALYEKLVEIGRTARWSGISGTTHVNNVALQKTAESQGRKLVALIYEHKLFPVESEPTCATD